MKAVFKTTRPQGENPRVPPDLQAQSFSAGEYIFREGELGTEMYIIQEGVVTISKTLAGTPRAISKLEKGDFFGEMAVLEHMPRTADAIAETDVRVIPINGSRFDQMLRRNPEIAVRIIRKYSQRLRDANRLLEQLAEGAPVVSPEGVIAPEEPSAVVESAPDDGSGPRLVDLSTGEAFYFGPDEISTIGRSDPVTGIRPQIDLGESDTNRSVSRRHAKIVKTSDGWAVLEEVGTTNGTFVNEQRVPPGVAVPLMHGDRLKIGLVELRVVLDS